MDNRDQRDESIRHPEPETAARDPHNAELQNHVHADSEASRREAARVRASTPNEVSEEAVADIAAEAEARARR